MTDVRWSSLCHLTWSPRLSPVSAALLPSSTDSTKMPNPLSLPPCTLKYSGDSLDAFCRVICLNLALAAHAMFSSRKWPFIFWQWATEGKIKIPTYGCNFNVQAKVRMFSRCWTKHKVKAEKCLTVISRSFSKSSRKRVMAGLPSKSLKWLLTHSSTILVTCSDIMSHVSCVPLC